MIRVDRYFEFTDGPLREFETDMELPNQRDCANFTCAVRQFVTAGDAMTLVIPQNGVRLTTRYAFPVGGLVGASLVDWRNADGRSFPLAATANVGIFSDDRMRSRDLFVEQDFSQQQ